MFREVLFEKDEDEEDKAGEGPESHALFGGIQVCEAREGKQDAGEAEEEERFVTAPEGVGSECGGDGGSRDETGREKRGGGPEGSELGRGVPPKEEDPEQEKRCRGDSGELHASGEKEKSGEQEDGRVGEGEEDGEKGGEDGTVVQGREEQQGNAQDFAAVLFRRVRVFEERGVEDHEGRREDGPSGGKKMLREAGERGGGKDREEQRDEAKRGAGWSGEVDGEARKEQEQRRAGLEPIGEMKHSREGSFEDGISHPGLIEPEAAADAEKAERGGRQGEEQREAPIPGDRVGLRAVRYHYTSMQYTAEMVAEACADLKPGRALDLACGKGRHAVWLAERGWKVTAVDRSEEAIAALRAACPQVDARVADLEKHEFEFEPGAWDLIVISLYLQRDLFEPAKQGLKPGGVLVAIVLLENGSGGRFRMKPGELATYFEGWEVLGRFEGRRDGHWTSEIAVRKPA